MPDSDTDGDKPCIMHASVKAPAFMETCVTGWFSIMESQFHIARVKTNETKFHHILAALPPTIIVRVPTATLNSKNYEELKSCIIDLYEQTKPELFNQLIGSKVMQGKPSVYLEEIRRTASKLGVTDDLVKHKFLQAVPSSISAVLASQKNMDLVELGKLADELVVFSQSYKPISAVDQTSVTHQHSVGLPRHTSSPTSNLSKGVQPFHKNQRPKVCRAHLYFGTEAKWCKPWCQWPTKASHIQMKNSSRASSPAASSRSTSPARNGAGSNSSENY